MAETTMTQILAKEGQCTTQKKCTTRYNIQDYGFLDVKSILVLMFQRDVLPSISALEVACGRYIQIYCLKQKGRRRRQYLPPELPGYSTIIQKKTPRKPHTSETR